MTQQTTPERMQCMEVWGGNRPVQRAIALTGLDLWVYSRPQGGAEAGGDVHYVSSCGSGRVTRVLLADISGHGEKMAQVAEALRTLMQRYVNYIDQRAMVERMNERFHEWVGEGLFATALVGTFFAPTRHFTLSNAGHPPPLYYEVKAKRWRILEEKQQSARALRNIPLGALQKVRYEPLTVRLAPNDYVLWYTDSLIEARSENADMLSTDGLLDLVNALPAPDGQEFLNSLLTRVGSYTNMRLQDSDDVTLILMRCTGEGAQAPLEYRLKGMLRFFSSTICRNKEAKDPIPWPEVSIPNILGGIFPFFNRFWDPTRKKS